MTTSPFLAFLPCALLTACSGLTSTIKDDTAGHNLDSGGGGGDTTDTVDSGSGQNSAPIADAGDDQDAQVGMVVPMDGGGSSDPDGDSLDYSWTIIEAPTGSSASLINGSFVDPQFIPDLPGRYVVELVVSDGELSSNPDSLEIVAVEDNGIPVADAGRDQSIVTGSTASLDGTGSVDPDGDSLVYTWTMISRPGGSAASLSSAGTANPSFVADVDGSYQVSLTVSDGDSYSDPDVVVISASTDSGGTDSGCGCHTPTDSAAGGLFTLAAAGLVGLLRQRRR